MITVVCHCCGFRSLWLCGFACCWGLLFNRGLSSKVLRICLNGELAGPPTLGFSGLVVYTCLGIRRFVNWVLGLLSRNFPKGATSLKTVPALQPRNQNHYYHYHNHYNHHDKSHYHYYNHLCCCCCCWCCCCCCCYLLLLAATCCWHNETNDSKLDPNLRTLKPLFNLSKP